MILCYRESQDHLNGFGDVLELGSVVEMCGEFQVCCQADVDLSAGGRARKGKRAKIMQLWIPKTSQGFQKSQGTHYQLIGVEL